MDENETPIAYTEPGVGTAPVWCPDCEPSCDGGLFGGVETEPMHLTDLENFEELSCVSCGVPLLAAGEPANDPPNVHNVDEYDTTPNYCPNGDTDGWDYCPFCGDELDDEAGADPHAGQPAAEPGGPSRDI